MIEHRENDGSAAKETAMIAKGGSKRRQREEVTSWRRQIIVLSLHMMSN